jgi:MazG family protein
MSTPSRRAGKLKERKRRRKSSTKRGQPSAGECFEKLVALQARLRASNGCPWDREQTHLSLRTYLLEEAYEVLEALEAGNDAKFAEEMGDLLLQIVFHSQIAGEEGRFTVSDVIRGVHDKMVRRHPHVFGKTKARTAKAVLKNWEQLKAEERRAERGEETKAGRESGSLLDGVPKNVPAAMEAFQLTRRAARIGFDWENIEDLLEKWQEETAELRQALNTNDSARIEEEAGDLLFVAVNLARHLHVDPEIALKKANRKFAARFRAMEKLASEKGSSLAAAGRDELEDYWEKAKRGERSAP